MEAKEKTSLGEIFRVGEKKSAILLFGLLTLGILLFVAGNFTGNGQEPGPPPVNNKGQETEITREERDLEKRLEGLLSLIEGAGKVEVSVFLASGTRYEYAVNASGTERVVDEQDPGGGVRLTTENNSTDQFVLVRGNQAGGEQPVIIQEESPSIQGVLIVADGAKNARIKARLWRAVQTGLGMEAHRIQVLPREGR